MLQFCKNLPSICHRKINARNKEIKIIMPRIQQGNIIEEVFFNKGATSAARRAPIEGARPIPETMVPSFPRQ